METTSKTNVKFLAALSESVIFPAGLANEQQNKTFKQSHGANLYVEGSVYE
jgi:hypothetical protein